MFSFIAVKHLGKMHLFLAHRSLHASARCVDAESSDARQQSRAEQRRNKVCRDESSSLFAQTCQVFDEREQCTEHRGEKLKLTYESFHASITPVLTLVLIIGIWISEILHLFCIMLGCSFFCLCQRKHKMKYSAVRLRYCFYISL